MYGIVNKAVKGLVVEKFGDQAWERIKERSNIHIDVFLSNEPYDDSITYDLAIAASEVLNISLHDVLYALGEYWILHTGMKNYGSLLESGGMNLKEFLTNLPNFHSRIMLMFPKLQPPEFRVSDVEDTSIHVHYYSDRPSLQPFVMGLLNGCAQMYQTEANIEMLQSRTEGADHEIFKVSWS